MRCVYEVVVLLSGMVMWYTRPRLGAETINKTHGTVAIWQCIHPWSGDPADLLVIMMNSVIRKNLKAHCKECQKIGMEVQIFDGAPCFLVLALPG